MSDPFKTGDTCRTPDGLVVHYARDEGDGLARIEPSSFGPTISRPTVVPKAKLTHVMSSLADPSASDPTAEPSTAKSKGGGWFGAGAIVQTDKGKYAEVARIFNDGVMLLPTKLGSPTIDRPQKYAAGSLKFVWDPKPSQELVKSKLAEVEAADRQAFEYLRREGRV
jgi:hypothetical protein